MCRLFGLRATHPTTVGCCLVQAGNSLMAQSRRDVHGFENADGWGIAAWQGEGPEPRFQRRSHAAHQSEEFRAAVARVEATTVLAHVRRATVGRVAEVNTHPFTHGRFAFAHNGTVPYFERVREDMLEAMTPEHRASIQGTTDSEHLFHLLLSEHGRQPGRPLLAVVRATLQRIVAWCRREGSEPRLGLNVLLSDGERLVGSRWQRTLSWLERRGLAPCEVCGGAHAGGALRDDYRAVVVASEPITFEPWREVPERSVYEIRPDFTLRDEPLEMA
jgi:predicted glutamine amidotransferase